MKTAMQSVAPDEFILSVLSPEKRLSAAFKLAEVAFRGTDLTVADIQSAVKKLRKKRYDKMASRR
jgi:hypothetical protein